MTRLPPELTDHIIDFLHSDSDALGVCALVCKIWLPASRYHLRVDLHDHKFQDLIELLDSPLSTFATYTHALHIVFRNREHPAQITPHLHKFVAVRSLHFQGSWTFVSQQQEQVIARSFPGITSLYLTDIKFRFPCHLLNFISHFQSLEHLNLGLCLNFFDSTLDAIRPTSLKYPQRLRSLSVDRAFGSHGLLWLISLVPLPPVTKIKLVIGTQDMLGLQSILHSLGPSLRLLDLHLLLNSKIESFQEFIDLTHNTCLVSLALEGIRIRNGTVDTDRESLIKIFSRITSPHLTNTRLRLWPSRSEFIKTLDWTPVWKTLVHPRFSRLQNIDILIEKRAEQEDEARWDAAINILREGMSLFRDRGVLVSVSHE